MKKSRKLMKKAVTKAVKTLKRPVKLAVKKAAPNTGKAPSPAKSMTANFAKKDLEEIKFKLSEMRKSLSKNVEDKKNLDMLEPEVGDSIDQATQSLDKEILFELSDNERKTLDNIDAALRKMDNGIYGICEHCKRHIEKKRLKALPSARYCLPCQSGAEKSRQQ